MENSAENLNLGKLLLTPSADYVYMKWIAWALFHYLE